MIELLAFIVGAALGALVLWVWARGEIGRQQALAAAAAERTALVERTQGQWDEHLKALTGDALATSSSSLLELTEAKLEPITETLDRFDEQAQALEQKRLTAVGSIDEHLRTVTEGQDRLRKETGSLVTALRAPHVRGRWGEMQLKRVVELAGMVAHCDFVEQASERDDDGRLLRPDLVVKLPGGKNLVVDSKAPLEAYLDAAAAEDEDARRAHLVRHARLVREHMTKLGQKRYWQQFEPAPEFVVMFLGDEAWFRAALDHDPSLLEAGVEAGVVPASPTTLIALLPDGRLRLAAGDGRRERADRQPARPRALRAARRVRRAFRQRRQVARRRDRQLQQGGRLVRDARARDGAQVPRARRRQRRAARGAAAHDASRGRSSLPRSRETTSRRRTAVPRGRRRLTGTFARPPVV